MRHSVRTILIGGLASMILCFPPAGHAQPAQLAPAPCREPRPEACLVASAAPPPPAAEAADPDRLSFSRLGIAERQLRGPFSATALEFGLPSNWELLAGAELQLHLQFLAIDTRLTAAGPSPASLLTVRLNNVPLGTLALTQNGELAERLAISPAALAAVPRDGRHTLALTLETDEECGDDRQTTLFIRASSLLVLPHRLRPLPTDLGLLPRPLYQRALAPDMATLVVPDRPSAEELQAALTVAAGLGRMTSGGLALALVPQRQLTAEQRTGTHLIAVGTAASLGWLAPDLPGLPLRGQALAIAGMQADDGLIQLFGSPWSHEHALLLVAGNTPAGLLKAGQALSSGSVRPGSRPDRALIAAIQPNAAPANPAIDSTLADLGYEVRELLGPGAEFTSYRFDIAPSQVISGEAYLDLSYIHSALLDYEQSGLSVSLNSNPIGSVRFDDNSTRLSQLRLTIPANAVRAGSNVLSVRADLEPFDPCFDPQGGGLWLSIRPETLLHLPLNAGSSNPVKRKPLSLADYPLPFVLGPRLERVAMVVSPDDPVAWGQAARLAFDLGRRTDRAPLELAAAYADALPADLRQQRDLLLVGRASQLPLLAELREWLPAPFEPASDLASEPQAPVRYRVEPGTSIGYLELLPAPWDAERSILAVLGSTPQGLAWAGAALTAPELRGRLAGNYAAVIGTQIEASTITLEPPPAAMPTPAPAAPPASAAGFGVSRLVLLGGISAGLVVLAAGVWLWLARRRRARSS